MDPERNILIDLEELSALIIDSIKGFEHLVKKIEEGPLKEFFRKCEIESEEIWEELTQEILNNKGEVKAKGTMKGAINHIWMKLKSDVFQQDLKEILKNIEYCEEFNLSRYEHVLKNDMPDPIRKILRRHHSMLRTRKEEIKRLRDSLPSD